MHDVALPVGLALGALLVAFGLRMWLAYAEAFSLIKAASTRGRVPWRVKLVMLVTFNIRLGAVREFAREWPRVLLRTKGFRRIRRLLISQQADLRDAAAAREGRDDDLVRHVGASGPSSMTGDHTSTMRIAEVNLLFEHLYWMRDRIIGNVRREPGSFLDPTSITTRDLRATLVHELDVEWSWRERLARPAPPRAFGQAETELRPDDYPTIEVLAEHWRRDELEMRSWLARLTDADLMTPWQLGSSAGRPLWQYLIHLYAHGIQQLSDAATILTYLGASPGEIDFLDFLRTREAAGTEAQ